MRYDELDVNSGFALNLASKDVLEDWKLNQLRDLGHMIGVYLPTTYKKADLIDEIWKIYTGEKEPHVKTTKKGRPLKDYFDIKDLVNNKSNVEFNDFQLSKKQVLTLNSSSFEFAEAERCSKVDVSGLVLSCRDYFVLIPANWCNDAYFIPNIIVKKYGLVAGDYIEAKAENRDGFNRLIVIKVLKINGQAIDYSLDIDFESSKSIDRITHLFESPLFNNAESTVINTICPIRAGDRVIACAEDKLELITGMYSIVKKLTLNPQNEVICLLINSTPEHIKVFDNIENVRLISTSFDVDDVCQTGQFELALKHIKRLTSKLEKNIIQIVVDLDNVLSEYDKCNVSRTEYMKLIDENFSSAKIIQNNSLTIIYGMLYNGRSYLELNGTENVKVALTGKALVRLSDYKIDILNTYRTDMLSNSASDDLENAIKRFVARGEYNDRHLAFEQFLRECSNVQDLIQKIK